MKGDTDINPLYQRSITVMSICLSSLWPQQNTHLNSSKFNQRTNRVVVVVPGNKITQIIIMSVNEFNDLMRIHI